MAELKTQQNIPRGWGQKTLSDLVLIKKGEQLNKLAMDEAGKYPALNGGISPSGYTDKWNTEVNTITISEGGNSCGYVNFNRERFWCGGHCYALLNPKGNINNDFLYQALKAKQSSLMKLRVGSGLPNIQKGSVEEFPLLVPESIDEQRRIAEILGTVDEDITKTQEVIDVTEKLKRGLMQQLFTHGIGHTKFKETKIGQIPEDWDVYNCENVATEIVDCKNRTPKYFPEGKYFVVRTPNVRNGRLILEEALYTDLENFKEWTKRGVPQKNDLLITREAPAGEVCLVPENLSLCLGQRMMYIRPNQSLIDPTFLLYFIQSDVIQKYLNLHSSGSTVTHLRVSQIKEIPVGVPKLDEQKRIAEILFAVSEKISVNKKLKVKLLLLKKGLMQDLLSGKVRTNI
jgi:type I restriction enzyme S subunit